MPRLQFIADSSIFPSNVLRWISRFLEDKISMFKTIYIGYFFAASPVVLSIYLIYTQIKLQKLITYINKSKDISRFDQQVPFLYFILAIPMCRYGFAIQLYKTRTPANDILEKFPNYKTLRIISNIALISHISIGALAITTILIVQIFI